MYLVYKAQYGCVTYYGVTTNLKKRRTDHIRNYSRDTTKFYPCNDSIDAIVDYGVHPKEWEFTVIEDGLTSDEAYSLKARMIKMDARAINRKYRKN